MNNAIFKLQNMLGKMNPMQIATNLSGNNPMLNNLINLARQGDKKGVEQFARNFFKENNRDFDKEFSEFMKYFK